MKYATLTFHRTTNYGAMLQTYALQRAIEKMGVETEVLDYRSPALEARLKGWKWYRYLDPRIIYAFIARNSYKRDNRKSFKAFSDVYIKKSPRIYTTRNELEEAGNYYDKFIVGSDQVWNPGCTGWDDNFFLNFTKLHKRNSYAASFGFSDTNGDEREWLTQKLKGFNHVSVREASGVKLYEELTGDMSEQVMDPTFLLSKEEWSEIAAKKIVRQEKKPYILLYLLAETNSIIDFAKKVASETGRKVIYINDRLLPKRGIVNKFYVSPAEWLSYFINADLVVTNSFHGIAFSTNLNLQFWVELLPPPSNVNARILDLLEALDLSSRIITNDIDINCKINYSITNKVLEKMKSQSVNYLQKLINE